VESWAAASGSPPGPGCPEASAVTVFKGGGRRPTRRPLPATHATTRPRHPAAPPWRCWRPHCRRTSKLIVAAQRPSGHSPSPTWAMCVGHLGSSRKISDQLGCSGTRVTDIPHVPNKPWGVGVIPGRKDRPDLFHTAEGFAAPAIECRCLGAELGHCDHDPPPRRHDRAGEGEAQRRLKWWPVLSSSPAPSADEVRAGGAIPCLIGRSLTTRCEPSWAAALGVVHSPVGRG